MPTRFYLPSTGAAAVSPAYSSGWEDTSIASRLKCVVAKISSAMATVSFLDNDATDKDILFRQWVSDPIAAQTIAAQTVKIQVRGQEAGEARNMFLAWAIKVMSNDGTVERGVLVALQRDATELDSTPTLTNRGDSATSTQVVALVGDRIVIEIGGGGDPGLASDHDSDLSVGDDNVSDLPENDTTTTANNPWVEFANALSWHYTSSVAGAQPAATGTIVRASGVFARSVVGAAGSISGAVTRTAGSFVRSIAGSQPAATGAAFKSALGHVIKALRVTAIYSTAIRSTTTYFRGLRITTTYLSSLRQTTLYKSVSRVTTRYLTAIRNILRY